MFKQKHADPQGLITFTVRDSGLQISAPGFSLTTGRPQLVVCAPDGTNPRRLPPSGRPQVRTQSCETYAGRAKQIRFTWRLAEELEFTWQLRLPEHLPVLTCGGSLRNLGTTDVHLEEVVWPPAANGEYLACAGDAVDWVLATMGESSRGGNLKQQLPSANEQTLEVWKGFGMPVPFPLPTDDYHRDGRWRCFRDFLTLYSAGGEQGLLCAPAGAACNELAYRGRVDSSRAELNLVEKLDRVRLQPGETRELQEMALICLPYVPAQELALRWLAATHGARTTRRPGVGWCSWYSRGPGVTAEDVSQLCAAADRLPASARLEYIQIDDGFQKTVGDWTGNEKFPGGLRPLVKKIRATGAQAGIWLAPLAVHESTEIHRRHPDWFQRNAQGELAGEARNWGPVSHWLDPTHPEVRRWLRQLLQRFKRDGFTYFKIDFNTISPEACLHDRSLTHLEAYRQLYALYRETLGEENYLLSCSGFTRGTLGYADGSRIAPDSCSVWSAAHTCCISACLRIAGSSSPANGIWYASDPDVTYLGPEGRLNEDEWRTWHSFVGLLGGFVMFSSEIWQQPSADRVRNLEILLPPAPEKGRSLRGGTDLLHRLMGFTALRPWGDSATVGLYNSAGVPRDLALTGPEAGLGDAPTWRVFSFWDETCRQIKGPEIKLRKIPAHGCAVLRIAPAVESADAPVFTGSTLHISCGAAEVCEFRAAGGELFCTLNPAGAREGALFVEYPGELELAGGQGLEAQAPRRSGRGFWRIDVANRDLGQLQHLRLRYKR